MSPETWCGNEKNGHVFVQRVCFVSVPHCLYCAIQHVPTEATRGDDFAQTIDVGVEWKRGRELSKYRKRQCRPIDMCSPYFTCKYLSSKTNGNPSNTKLGSPLPPLRNAGIGAEGSDVRRVSKMGAEPGSDRRVIQNANGDAS
jgi:hypothetical protein